MASSPLQLMSRMASVVKGKHPTSIQIEDVVDSANDSTSSVSSEIASIKKKGLEGTNSNRFADYIISFYGFVYLFKYIYIYITTFDC